MNITFFKFDDHVIWVQNPQKEVYLFMGPPVASGEVSLTLLTSTLVGEYHRVFYNYPGPKNEQCHTQTV